MAEFETKFEEDFKDCHPKRFDFFYEIPSKLRHYVTSVNGRTNHDETYVAAKIGPFKYEEINYEDGDYDSGYYTSVLKQELVLGRKTVVDFQVHSEINDDIMEVLLIYSAVIQKLKKMPESEIRFSKAFALKQKIEENIIAYRNHKIENVKDGIPSRPDLVEKAKAEAYVAMYKHSGLPCSMKMRRLMYKDPVFFMNNARSMYDELLKSKSMKVKMAKTNKEYRETRRNMKMAHKVEMQKMRAERRKERQKEARELKGVNLER